MDALRDFGLLIPYAEYADGRLVFPREVAPGAEAGLRCPSCHAALLVKRGMVRRTHFAHFSSTSCEGALETVVHRMAKQVLAGATSILIPGLTPSGEYQSCQPLPRFRPESFSSQAWRLRPPQRVFAQTRV